jgi:hypothetical protein
MKGVGGLNGWRWIFIMVSYFLRAVLALVAGQMTLILTAYHSKESLPFA